MTVRQPIYDNARGVLCLLVVIGHAVEPLVPAEPVAKALYQLLYAFHIPAFVALSGALSPERWDFWGVARSLLRPLLLFQALYVAFDRVVLRHPWNWAYVVQPYWLLWFLLSLSLWRLSLPLFMQLPAPFALSIGLALGAGTVQAIGYPGSLSRTLVFFPFFVGGHLYLRKLLPHLAHARLPALLLFGAVLAVLSGKAIHDNRLLYGSVGYAALGLSEAQGLLERAIQIFTGAALVSAFFALCPRLDGPFTERGRRSLFVYVWHGFAVKGADAFGAYGPLRGPAGVAWAAAGGVALFFLLSSIPGRRKALPS